ncbi:hypothetical protein PHYBLDRAFT_69756 [Phycomyces blakesleeanus NRRL 1555(-)]|uniref:Uncharacterized protein n=1 Tax=Phycomyces blakesleeanus (strain ATCC 8743b / DSM 1359 / FGSC 10004 / NBRC 33097 / NRRL 1555) TaxID=763407 RepID=A0A162UVP0_PHYB8|nr:hypothetical protein PHYBLDRAFT_69756 [Phycomyces blakesleeanus NRRL 1555(-)]OAD78303.1 hypothetical protein PHYBLDRAFT_69756 [Phycomyces blakesleeanus NRRL 1555(-)]|eukprot:XP_018296343.1 hypothetical protein PHYBLDRAFT_69756 [Phycomyces blakesleeanus NRRL 1555(-)]
MNNPENHPENQKGQYLFQILQHTLQASKDLKDPFDDDTAFNNTSSLIVYCAPDIRSKHNILCNNIQSICDKQEELIKQMFLGAHLAADLAKNNISAENIMLLVS